MRLLISLLPHRLHLSPCRKLRDSHSRSCQSCLRAVAAAIAVKVIVEVLVLALAAHYLLLPKAEQV